MVVRERNGLSYNIEASYTPYGDTGIVAIYFSSEHGNAEQCIELIEGQLQRLRTQPPHQPPALDGQEAVHRPAGHFERKQRKLHAQCRKKLLTHDEIDTMEQVYAKVRETDRRTADRSRRGGLFGDVAPHYK